jgi:hypothetical protein
MVTTAGFEEKESGLRREFRKRDIPLPIEERKTEIHGDPGPPANITIMNLYH